MDEINEIDAHIFRAQEPLASPWNHTAR
jgi:hypothetical protein